MELCRWGDKVELIYCLYIFVRGNLCISNFWHTKTLQSLEGITKRQIVEQKLISFNTGSVATQY